MIKALHDSIGGKRATLAGIIHRTRAYRGIRHFGPKSLLVFVYHRIRSDAAAASAFDDGVWGPTQETFRDEMRWLKKNADVISESDLVAHVQGGAKLPTSSVMVTFDDGYADNGELALPILSELKIPAMFFIPTRAIEKRELGWWDVIAYLLKRTEHRQLTFRDESFDLGAGRASAIARIQGWMRTRKAEETKGLVEELARACGVELPDVETQSRELMTWDQIRAADAAGITIGSHTHSHRVLSTLSIEEQLEELTLSKAILERKIGKPVRSIAYPVGAYEDFHQETTQLAKRCGYALGFSFCTGFNRIRSIDSLRVCRVPVTGSIPLICATIAAPALFAETSGPLRGPRSLSKSDGNRKVMMLTPGLTIGGLERMILNLSESLKTLLDWRPQVMAFDCPANSHPDSDLVTSFLTLGIPVDATTKPPRFSIWTAINIARKARADRTAIIHTHDLGALIYGSIAKILLFGRVRLIHTQHSFVHLGRSWKYRYYERLFTRLADAIAVVSEDTRQSYLKLHVPEQKLHLIPNGVAFPADPYDDREKMIEHRQRLIAGLPCEPRLASKVDGLWIVYIARIHGRKGQDHAIRAWEQLDPELRKTATLLFVGPETDSGMSEQLRAMIGAAPDGDRITCIGSSQHPQKWLEAADLFLSCSEFEGMPLGPVEAVGSGVPTVLSKIPGHEFLSAVAELYPLERSESCARAIEASLRRTLRDSRNYRSELWLRAALVRETFTSNAMSVRYQRLYEAN